MTPKSADRFSDKVVRKNNMRVVIAGFGPFPGAPSNPSDHLATALARRRRPALAGVEITSHVFATAYDAVDRDLPKLLARRPNPDLRSGCATTAHLHRDTGPQCALDLVSGCQRLASAAGSDRGRPMCVDGQRAVPASPQYATPSRVARPFVARRRHVPLQLRLLARFAGCARRPAASAIRSHTVG